MIVLDPKKQQKKEAAQEKPSAAGVPKQKRKKEQVPQEKPSAAGMVCRSKKGEQNEEVAQEKPLLLVC